MAIGTLVVSAQASYLTHLQAMRLLFTGLLILLGHMVISRGGYAIRHWRESPIWAHSTPSRVLARLTLMVATGVIGWLVATQLVIPGIREYYLSGAR